MIVIPQSTYANSLFKNGVAKGQDGDVRKAIFESINELITNPSDIPKGKDLEPTIMTLHADFKSSLKVVKEVYDGQTVGSISLTLLGESHIDQKDKERATAFIQAINDGFIDPNTFTLERGMTYNPPNTGIPIIREENLTTTSSGIWFGEALTAHQRSLVIAGYLVLITASGNLNDIVKHFILFGDNHRDILKEFDYFSRHTTAFYLQKLPRTFLTIPSQAK